MESKLFNAELDDQLIGFVRDHRILYDPSCKQYKDLKKRDDAWKECANKLQKSPEECKMRWKTIRDSYKKNMNKIRAGAGLRSKYSDKKLQFLDKTFKTVIVIPDSSYQTPQLEQDEDSCTSADLQQLSGTADDSEEACDQEQDPLSTEPVRKKIKVMLPKEEAKSSREESSIKESPLSGVNSSVDLFYRSIAETVKDLPKNLQIEARLRVCKLITELELKALQQNHE